MAKITYNGVELKEFTSDKPVIFDRYNKITPYPIPLPRGIFYIVYSESIYRCRIFKDFYNDSLAPEPFTRITRKIAYSVAPRRV